MQRWLTINTVIILGIGAAVVFPLLDLIGLEVKSAYIVATIVVMMLLVSTILFQSLRSLIARFKQRISGKR